MNEGEQRTRRRGRHGFVSFSRKDSVAERSFHSQGPTELQDLSPNVRCLNNGVARLWPAADLRERECTFLLSRFDRHDGLRPFRGLKVIFRIVLLHVFINGQPTKLLKEGVM